MTVCFSPVYATPGDIGISVKYKVHSTRVRPNPAQSDGAGNLKIVLHANGDVDDVVEGEGNNPKQWQLKKRKLGAHKSGVQYRVIDRNTILRTFADKTHIYEVKIAVDGESYKAEVKYTLKPGQKEFEIYSPQLGALAYYSDLTPFDVQCKIERDEVRGLRVDVRRLKSCGAGSATKILTAGWIGGHRYRRSSS
jgi:hypothetical protein